MKTTKSLNFEVWTISIHNPKPLNYSMYCDSAFCQPADAVERARKIAQKEKKYGAPHVWAGVFDVEDGVCYNQYFHNPPSDIDETIEHIGKVLTAAIL